MLTFSRAVTALALAAVFAAGPLAAADKPNVLFIAVDDLRPELACYGAAHMQTPNIDRLASQGMRFTDAHTPSSVCTPTRYGLLTGRYCWRTSLKRGVLDGYSPLLIEPKRMTLASLLKQQGYATGCVGKWHLGLGTEKQTDYSKPLKSGPHEVGFDYYFGIPASLDMPPYGDPTAPIHQHVAPRYINDAVRETSVPNMVTAVLASYRGYDTLGETTVVFTAGIGVIVLLRRLRRGAGRLDPQAFHELVDLLRRLVDVEAEDLCAGGQTVVRPQEADTDHHERGDGCDFGECGQDRHADTCGKRRQQQQRRGAEQARGERPAPCGGRLSRRAGDGLDHGYL